jgi:ketosteroid isomerase-like protein
MLASQSLGTLRLARLVCAAALALFCLAPAATRARAQDESPLHTASHEELEIVKVLLIQEKAWNSGDLDTYLKGFKDSPDTVFMGRQISRGYAQIADDYRKNYPNRTMMGQLSFSELEAHPISDTLATCLGRYHLDRGRKDGGAADGIFSLVLEKTADGWKVILDHTS